MSKENYDIEKLSMFYPKTRKGLKDDYPELSKIEAFKTLNKNDLLFVWYYACKASPFYREEELSIRAKKSVIESYGEIAGEKMCRAYSAGNFPEKIRIAIPEMGKFQIGPRIKAKLMVEKIMNNYSELIDINVETEFKDKEGEEDWTKKKAYIDSCAKISAALPTLIIQSEGSFGVTEKDDGETIEVEPSSIVDKFHES